MQFYSQDGQDKFIVSLFRNKKNGFFLDIGAYDGVNFSNSFYLEKNLSWKGICVEPNPFIYEKLKANRNCISLNCCVSDVKGTYKFLSVSGWGSMLSGLLDFYDAKHLERIDKTIQEHGGTKTIVDIMVQPLRDILDEYSVATIDYCNIDVEGGEMNVLKSIDFSKVKIKVFTIENNYYALNVRKFLRSHSYKLIAKIGADEVYELNSIRFGLMLKWRINKIKYHVASIYNSIKTRLGFNS